MDAPCGSGCAPSESALSKEAEGQLILKSAISLVNLLVRNYRAECTEFNMGALGVCLDVKLCLVLRLAPGKGG